MVTDDDPPVAADALPAALPVAFDVRERLGLTLRRTVEGQLGWQPVDADTAALVPPAVRLVDVTAAGPDPVPTVLVVAPDDDPYEAAEAGHRLRPQAIVTWPGDGPGLVAAVAAATAAPRSLGPAATVTRVGGAAGGTGTTTVALALAGLAAWRGRPTLIASRDRLLLPAAAPRVEPPALAAADLWARAAPVVGVPQARAVRTTSPPVDVAVADPRASVVVLDLGVADDVDVLVCRADAAGRDAIARTSAAAVVVVGEGPVPRRELVAVIGGRRRVEVPWSARAARAALVGRVPAALPGRLVHALAPLLPAGEVSATA